MKDSASEASGLEQKIDILIKLVALSVARDCTTLKEKAILLSRAGLSSRDIANLFGTTPNTVSVALSAAKRRAKIDNGSPEGTQNAES